MTTAQNCACGWYYYSVSIPSSSQMKTLALLLHASSLLGVLGATLHWKGSNSQRPHLSLSRLEQIAAGVCTWPGVQHPCSCLGGSGISGSVVVSGNFVVPMDLFNPSHRPLSQYWWYDSDFRFPISGTQEESKCIIIRHHILHWFPEVADLKNQLFTQVQLDKQDQSKTPSGELPNKGSDQAPSALLSVFNLYEDLTSFLVTKAVCKPGAHTAFPGLQERVFDCTFIHEPIRGNGSSPSKSRL